jgi:hypothetical protein
MILISRALITRVVIASMCAFRYMLDTVGNTKRAFQAVDVRIESLLAHRCISMSIIILTMIHPIFLDSVILHEHESLMLRVMMICRLCPSLLRTGYGYLRGFLARQVQPPSQTAGAGGSGGAGGPMGGLMQQVAGMASKCTIC